MQHYSICIAYIIPYVRIYLWEGKNIYLSFCEIANGTHINEECKWRAVATLCVNCALLGTPCEGGCQQQSKNGSVYNGGSTHFGTARIFKKKYAQGQLACQQHPYVWNCLLSLPCMSYRKQLKANWITPFYVDT